MGRLLLLFIIVPLVDMLLLTKVSSAIGFLNTVGLVIVTGMLGAWLSKREGARALQRWQEALSQGQLPEDGVVGSVLLLVGSVLLITPGVLTDAVGLALLIGPSRRFVARLLRPRLRGWVDNKVASGSTNDVGGSTSGRGSVFQFVSFGGRGGVGPFGGAPQRVEAEATSSQPIRRAPNRIIDVDFEVTDDEA